MAPDGRTYRASDPHLLHWVHLAEVDSFLAAYQRYGAAPLGTIDEGNVFTLEYGAPVPGRGYVGLEEDVLVTSDGVEWLSTPQRELWLVA